jgi:hypothetical protein
MIFTYTGKSRKFEFDFSFGKVLEILESSTHRYHEDLQRMPNFTLEDTIKFILSVGPNKVIEALNQIRFEHTLYLRIKTDLPSLISLMYPIQGDDILSYFAFGEDITNFGIDAMNLWGIPCTFSKTGTAEYIHIGQHKFKRTPDVELHSTQYIHEMVLISMRVLTNWLINKVNCSDYGSTIGNLKLPESITIGDTNQNCSNFTSEYGSINLSRELADMLDYLTGTVPDKWDFITQELLDLRGSFTIHNVDMGKFHLRGVGLLYKIIACDKLTYSPQELSGDDQICIDLKAGAKLITSYGDGSSKKFVRVHSTEFPISGLEFARLRKYTISGSVRYFPGKEFRLGRLDFDRDACKYVLKNFRKIAEDRAIEIYRKNHKSRVVDCLLTELKLWFRDQQMTAT